MKRIVLIMVGILAVVNLANSQITFEKTYDNGLIDKGTSVIALSDGYIMCGATQDNALGDFDIFVTRVDLNGDVTWSNIYTSLGTGDDFATYINVTSTGDFVITGNSTDPATADVDIFVLRINNAGVELWAETYDGGNAEDDGGNYIIESVTGGFYVCGYSSDGTATDMWVFEISNEGVFVAENFYGLNGDDQATCVVEMADGLAIIGQSYDDVNGDLDGVLIKTDISGDEVWKVYTTGTSDEIYNDFILDDNGDFLIVGAEEDEVNGDYDLLLASVSADGNTLNYSYTFDYNAGDDEAYRVYSDGTDYFIAGYVEDTDNGDVDAYIALIDVVSGDILGDEIYGDIYDDEFLDFDFASDGGFICIGFQEINDNMDSDIYLVKTNENGEIPTGISNLTKKLDITIYPNPVTNSLTIETAFSGVSDYSIKNINGQEVQNGQLNSSINVTTLKDGIYFIEVVNLNTTYTKKFIKQ